MPSKVFSGYFENSQDLTSVSQKILKIKQQERIVGEILEQKLFSQKEHLLPAKRSTMQVQQG